MEREISKDEETTASKKTHRREWDSMKETKLGVMGLWKLEKT
jgi:hypothetical protein